MNNAQRIAYEYGDLVAAMILLARECPDVQLGDLKAALETKRLKVEHYLNYSEEVGTLAGSTEEGREQR